MKPEIPVISTVSEAVGCSRYPGRGIITASCDGKMYIAYFIMGRSENSRNRVFESDGVSVRTRAFDESKMCDPSLVIYNAVMTLDSKIIVTNGDQTDTVYDYMKSGKTFYEALENRTFEPDSPNFTPRISALVNGLGVTMSIIRSVDGLGDRAVRSFYNYDRIEDGEGYFIHTYYASGDRLVSFFGEPERIVFSGNLYDFYSQIWDNLDFDNRISLWVCEYDPQTGKARGGIANKNTGEFIKLPVWELNNAERSEE